MFLVVQCSTWMPLVLYQEVTTGNLELATPGLAATGSPPWPGPDSLISICVKVGLEGRYSLLTGAGWWARGDLRYCHNHTYLSVGK